MYVCNDRLISGTESETLERNAIQSAKRGHEREAREENTLLKVVNIFSLDFPCHQ